MAGGTAILNSKQTYWGVIGQPLMHMCFDALSPLPTTNTTPIASQNIVVIDNGNGCILFSNLVLYLLQLIPFTYIYRVLHKLFGILSLRATRAIVFT